MFDNKYRFVDVLATYFMRLFTGLIFALIFLSSTASAAVCVGKNCELLESIASSKGLSMQSILDNIQGNIIDPIVDSQSRMVAWEGGMLDYSPAGSQNGIKVTLWGGTSFNWVSSRANFFGKEISSEYTTGIIRIGAASEIQISNSTDLILNAGFWYGDPDYGTGFIIGTNSEKTARLGVGTRHTFMNFGITKLYFTAGVLAGIRHFDTAYEGSKFLLRTPLGEVGWSGIESYSEEAAFISTPLTIGGNLKFWRLTLNAEAGARYSYQIGQISIGKFGPVGPFFGQSGFYNIGVSSARSVDSMQIWPILRLGFEWNVFSDMSVLGNWQPKIENSPHHLSVGAGWKFLSEDSAVFK